LPRHEHFEELAAVAAKGELTAPEQEELARHLTCCAPCKQTYDDYQELHAPLRTTLEGSMDPKMEAILESSREKVRGAVLEAIRSPQLEPIRSNLGFQPRAHSLTSGPLRVWAGLAAVTALALTFWLGTRYQQHIVNASGRLLEQSRITSGRDQTTGKHEATARGSEGASPAEQQQATLHAQLVQTLQNELREEKQRGTQLDASLTEAERELATSESSRTSLAQQVDSASQDLLSTEALLAAKTDELKQMETAKESDATNLVALEYQVQDLAQKLSDQTQSLNRERDLLANGRDIRDIIGARNLHIIDVYDTDADGNTRKSFARAFYTEGKSLIFYAYDLPARGTDEGKYVYTAWGQKNGNKSHVEKLGILLNDDKGQRRWALNFSDPKVLTEIDSVFVTLERVDMNGSEPKGKRMLTAYLDSQVNHP